MKRLIGITTALGLSAFAALAGSATWDFNSDPAAGTTPLTLLGGGNGGGDWVSYNGATGGDNDGYLSISGPSGGQWAKVIFPDIDGGKIIAAFTFECKLRIGNGSATPADGFSINYARATDPTFTKDGSGNYQAGGWSGTANEPGSTGGSLAGLPEEGTITGLAIGFDAYNSGSALWPADLNGTLNDVIGISVRVDNKIVAQVGMSTQNGACDDNTSLQTGPRNENDSADLSVLCWQPFKVQLTEDKHLSVWWKGRAVVDNLQVDFAPGAGRLVFGGRTGGSYQNQHIDDIVLSTIGADKALVTTAIADAVSVTANLEDSGDSLVNTNSVTLSVDGTFVTPLIITKAGTITTVRWISPAYFTSGQQLTVAVACKDTRDVPIAGTRTATVAAFNALPTANKVPATAVDTSKPGFLIRPFQTEAAQPNALVWTEEQLLGLHGANLADLTGAANGYLTRATVINYNVDAPTDIGNLDSTGGYTDDTFPGIPGTTGSNGSFSEEALAYLNFPTAGLYQLGVNSDDGFRVSAGRAPGDLLGVVLGYFDGGRGASDTIFSVLVTEPGFYPIRLIHENGSGEFSAGNGANLEFFSVKDGVKTLINDTTANAIKAYRQSSAYGPYVSNLAPQRGATAVPGNTIVMAEISDGSVQVDPASVKVKLNGAVTPATVTYASSKTTITVNSGLLPSGTSVTIAIEYSDKSTPAVAYTTQWQFAVATYTVIADDLWTAPGTGDAAKPGMKARVWQVDQPGSTSLANRTHRAEQELAGIIGPNVADLTSATDGVFNIDMVNWNQDYASAEIGDFRSTSTPSRPDEAIPGIPGTGSNPNDSIAAEVITYVEFPTAGFYSMGAFSDDGFKVTVADTPPKNNLALVVTGAASAAGSYATLSGPAVTSKPFTAPVSGKLVYMDPAIGCTALVNPEALRGNIALVDRGTCNFSAKIKAAKDAGAIACIVVNNRAIDNAEGIYPTEMGVGDAGYQDLPAVMISMPDGDKIKTGLASGLTVSISPDTTPAVGEVDGGSPGADVIFSFIVPKAGVYPFRLVWFEGNGGANIEWFSVTQSGTRILINDRENTAALKSFKARTATPQSKPTISLATQGGNMVITFTGTLQASDELTGQWADVNATSPYTTAASGAKKFFRSKR
jgi:hypothetical protein